MTDKKKNELTKPGFQLPDYASEFTEQDLHAGRLEDESGIIRPPILKVVNALSREKKDFLCEEGKWWSTGHNRVVGGVVRVDKDGIKEQEPVHVVPLDSRHEWMAFDDSQNLAWRTTNRDEASALAKGDLWKYDCLHVLVVAPFDIEDVEPLPMILTFMKTAFKSGTAWYQQYTRVIPLPCFAQKWEMRLLRKVNDKGAWYSAVPGGMTPLPKDLMLAMREAHKEWLKMPWIAEVQQNGHETEDSAPATAGGGESDEIPF